MLIDNTRYYNPGGAYGHEQMHVRNLLEAASAIGTILEGYERRGCRAKVVCEDDIWFINRWYNGYVIQNYLDAEANHKPKWSIIWKRLPTHSVAPAVEYKSPFAISAVMNRRMLLSVFLFLALCGFAQPETESVSPERSKRSAIVGMTMVEMS
ncbi:MAG: hypothetical protein M9935_05265 [Kiritimatiellae bacterium]|nr:hypothetical protein [Kiritimatiellia bacterium]